MSILTQLVQKSIEDLLNLDISEGVGEFIEGGMEIMTGFLCDLVKCRLEEMDDFIFANSDAKKDWKVVQKGRKRSILTKAGEVTYHRRYYENKETGLKACLVDALAGIEKFSKIETEHALELIRNATEMSYEKAGKNRDVAPVSKTAVMAKTRQAEDYSLPAEECNLSVKLDRVTSIDVVVAGDRDVFVCLKCIYISDAMKKLSFHELFLQNDSFFIMFDTSERRTVGFYTSETELESQIKSLEDPFIVQWTTTEIKPDGAYYN